MHRSYVSRAGKVRHKFPKSGSQGTELENHFILRLPEAQAKVLSEDIRNGQANIKDRLFIQLDHTQDKDDMRNGIITFDTIMYKARLVDLPTILETWKTIDRKNFYKTADICQMLKVIDPEEENQPDEPKKKRKDAYKLDRKYIWPHGYTPPLKNVRKKRFRKMKKKKVSHMESLDMPDIEKEVKRLLRTDNEAVTIKWEIIKEKETVNMPNPPEINLENDEPLDVDKQELFGELSSSDDELRHGDIKMLDEDDDSRMSLTQHDDSRSFMMSETANSPTKGVESHMHERNEHDALITEFSSSMFGSSMSESLNEQEQGTDQFRMFSEQGSEVPERETHLSTERETHLSTERETHLSTEQLNEQFDSLSTSELTSEQKFESSEHNIEQLISDTQNINLEIYGRYSELQGDLNKLYEQRSARESEIKTIENIALKQKLLDRLSLLEFEIEAKEAELNEVQNKLGC